MTTVVIDMIGLVSAEVPAQTTSRQIAPAVGPNYTKSGELLAPQGYKTWVFVGSNLGLSYKQDLSAMTTLEADRAVKQQFHNVYINREAFDSFKANKTFPEGTLLVMEVFEAADKEPKGIVANGAFNGRRMGLEMAVKNSARPDGKTTAWAYYDFTDRSGSGKDLATARAFPDEACAVCHKLHASVDNVWVQFYPTLRD